MALTKKTISPTINLPAEKELDFLLAFWRAAPAVYGLPARLPGWAKEGDPTETQLRYYVTFAGRRLFRRCVAEGRALLVPPGAPAQAARNQVEADFTEIGE